LKRRLFSDTKLSILSHENAYIALYYILIFSIFLEQAALSFPVPGIGSIYLFRVMVVVMVVLLVIVF